VLFERERLVAIEGIVLVVVVRETLLAERAVEIERGSLARDPHPARVVRVGEHLLEAPEDFGERGHPDLFRDAVQALEHLVHALAHEALDRLALGGDLPEVAVLEFARAALERRQPRMAVHVRGRCDRPLALIFQQRLGRSAVGRARILGSQALDGGGV
jgi:hypothetical protein